MQPKSFTVVRKKADPFFSPELSDLIGKCPYCVVIEMSRVQAKEKRATVFHNSVKTSWLWSYCRNELFFNWRTRSFLDGLYIPWLENLQFLVNGTKGTGLQLCWSITFFVPPLLTFAHLPFFSLSSSRCVEVRKEVQFLQ